MTSPYRIERDRGTKESPQQIAVLREKWPIAFPVKHQDVRPLALGAAGEIAAAMGWSLPYTLGVLGRWKMAPAARKAAKKAEAAADAVVKPKPTPGPPTEVAPETPEQLRARVRLKSAFAQSLPGKHRFCHIF
jgi:hypothetical protein